MNLDEFRFPLFKDRIFQIARIFKACFWGLEVRASCVRNLVALHVLNWRTKKIFLRIFVVVVAPTNSLKSFT